MPTIAAHSGIIGFSTQKLQHRKLPFYGDHKLPFMFGLWEGIDGSRIMAVPHAQDYVSRFDGQELSSNGKLVDLAKNGLNNTVYHYYGAGDRGGSPTIASVRSVETGMKGEGPVQIISARSGSYLMIIILLRSIRNCLFSKGNYLWMYMRQAVIHLKQP